MSLSVSLTNVSLIILPGGITEIITTCSVNGGLTSLILLIKTSQNLAQPMPLFSPSNVKFTAGVSRFHNFTEKIRKLSLRATFRNIHVFYKQLSCVAARLRFYQAIPKQLLRLTRALPSKHSPKHHTTL